jgi:uncharacterized DUF497 family protein
LRHPYDCATVRIVVEFRLGDLDFTWDPTKYTQNVRTHGVTFEDAATTWLDPLAIERADGAHSGHESRWLRMGGSLRGHLVVVWSTERTARGRIVIRIIGARRATPAERRRHEEENEEDG